MGSPSFKIIGFDPGSRLAGFACIEAQCLPPFSPRHFHVLEVGVAKFSKNDSFNTKIGQIHQFAHDLCQKYHPDICAVESAFFGINVSTALKLGEIRGALKSAIAHHNISLLEFSPAEIKKTITGGGRAEKDVVARSVLLMLGIKDFQLPFDATDALAIALTAGLGIPRQHNLSSQYFKTEDRVLD